MKLRTPIIAVLLVTYLVLATYLLVFDVSSLAPVIAAIVGAVFTVVIAKGFDISNSRIATLIGGLATLYATYGPQLSQYVALPKGVRAIVALIGIVLMATNERLHGGLSVPSKCLYAT